MRTLPTGRVAAVLLFLLSLAGCRSPGTVSKPNGPAPAEAPDAAELLRGCSVGDLPGANARMYACDTVIAAIRTLDLLAPPEEIVALQAKAIPGSVRVSELELPFELPDLVARRAEVGNARAGQVHLLAVASAGGSLRLSSCAWDVRVPSEEERCRSVLHALLANGRPATPVPSSDFHLVYAAGRHLEVPVGCRTLGEAVDCGDAQLLAADVTPDAPQSGNLEDLAAGFVHRLGASAIRQRRCTLAAKPGRCIILELEEPFGPYRQVVVARQEAGPLSARCASRTPTDALPPVCTQLIAFGEALPEPNLPKARSAITVQVDTQVVVASRDLPVGTELEVADLSKRKLPVHWATDSLVGASSVQYIVGQVLLAPARAGDPLRWAQFLTDPRPAYCDAIRGATHRSLEVTQPPRTVLVATRKLEAGERLVADALEPKALPEALRSLDHGPADRAEELYGLQLLEPMEPGDPVHLSALAELVDDDRCEVFASHCTNIFAERGAPPETRELSCPEGTRAISGIPWRARVSCGWMHGWVFWCRDAEGRADGPFVKWAPDGTKTEEGRMCRGEPCGEWSHWNDQGRLTSRSRYVGGVLDGEYMAGGEVLGSYAAGLRSGSWKLKSGARTVESAWAEGRAAGTWRVRDAKGRLRLEGSFEAGRPAGEWMAFDADGREVGRWRFGEDGSPATLTGPELVMRQVVVAARPLKAPGPVSAEDLESIRLPAYVVDSDFLESEHLRYVDGQKIEVHVPQGGIVSWRYFDSSPDPEPLEQPVPARNGE